MGFRPYNVDHVGIAVHDLEATLDEYRRLFGVEPLYREVVADQGVEEAMIPVGGTYLQFLQPLGDDTPVGRFLQKRGEGMHHIALAVIDIEEALTHLDQEHVKLIDTEARPGSRGTRIAFIHPGNVGGTLLELVEVPQ